MSLKTFHLFIMALVVVLAFAMAFWAFDNYQAAKDPTFLELAIVCGLSGIGLGVYGFFFSRKAKRIIG